ncbi:hypothetical protein VHEMI03738 [[Torrubiella] hemipterigena]|uniref:Peroxisomal multifunctional enzyme type 2-like N-terminal domain-containing protein n=1 Tax=[Torrubiella] hemipterigena TaxID=1531966 RepID=A0A0A1TBS2_9HYPO|nr:hypothetical protein VHEMI03738 [[Torrubiella] hemipterigena]
MSSKPSNEHLQAIEAAVGKLGPPVEFNYEDRETMLYNIGIGAKSDELKYVFEGDDEFQVIPTFGVLPGYTADMPFSFDSIIPNFNPMMLLHGEQYLEIRKYPIPTSANLISKSSLIEVVDKGNAAVVKTGLTVTHAETGEDIFYNEMTAFVRGSGGFDGNRVPADRGAATAANKPPARAPDFVQESATDIHQAAIFRLSGDYKYVFLPFFFFLLTTQLTIHELLPALFTSTPPSPRWAASRNPSFMASAHLAWQARPSTTSMALTRTSRSALREPSIPGRPS